MIYGIGIDIVHIPKFKKAVVKWGKKLKNRVFTDSELSYCEQRRHSDQHLAARFAAKEAFFKAVGMRGRLREIEVARSEERMPFLVSKPETFFSAKRSRVQNLKTHLTLSHDGDYCIAEVIVEVIE